MTRRPQRATPGYRSRAEHTREAAGIESRPAIALPYSEDEDNTDVRGLICHTVE
jgi:hypothetical protein